MFEFEFRTVHLVYLYYLSCSCGESCLLVSWYAGDMCDMVGRDEDRSRSRRADIEDHEWSHRSGTRWSDDREVG
jgi:hypothetical protein